MFATKLDPIIVDKAHQRFLHIFKGPGKQTTILENLRPMTKPDWYDEKLILHMRKLYNVYAFMLSKSGLYGLVFGIGFPESFIPLSSTGNSANIGCLFERYFSTIQHLKAWYQNDLFDNSSTGYRSIKIVRGLHRQVSSQFIKNAPEKAQELFQGVWFSQADYCVTQLAFIGYATIFPEHLGLQTWSDYDFEAFFHFWRVIGHCMGVEDQYNACVGTVGEIRAFCRVAFTEEKNRLLNPPIPEGRRMAEAVIWTNMIPPSVIYRYSSHFFGFSAETVPLKTFNEKLSYYLYDKIFHKLAKYTMGAWIISLFFHFSLWIVSCSVPTVKKMFSKKLMDENYNFEPSALCPMITKVNYRSFHKHKLA